MKKMAKIKIMVDSAADIPEEVLKKHNMGLIPMLSVFGDDAYVIGEDITTDEFYKKLETCESVPKTSLTPYAKLKEILLEESKNNDTVIYFTISSKASGQNHSANLVKEDILESDNPDADIRIIDSMTFSMIIGYDAINAAVDAEAGMSADEIIEKATKSIAKWRVLFVVSDLMYLEKGGRLRKSTAILGNLLDIKPVLTVSDGMIEVETKLRGKKKICQKICNLIEEYGDLDESAEDFIILHSDFDKAAEAEEAIKENFGDDKNVILCQLGPLIGTHTGSGIVAFVYRTK